MHRFALFSLAAAAALLAGHAPAQLWVELTRVPDEVTGPLKDGRNLLVTVTIHGTNASAVEEVWIAEDPGDSQRALLTRSGPSLWQINLATGRAAELLESMGEGSVAVHARTAGGDTASSVPIHFDVPRSERGSEGRFSSVVAIGEDGRRFRSGPDDELWLVPEEVECIEVRLWSRDPDLSVDARAGERKWPLRREDDRTAELDVTEEIAKLWRESEELILHVGEEERMRLRAVPRTIGPEEHLRFTVGQREHLELPGSGGSLEVTLSDITAGQVRVGVRTKDGRDLIRRRSMREGERLRFEHGGETYVLELDCLVNFLIGHDYAEFEIWKPSTGP